MRYDPKKDTEHRQAIAVGRVSVADAEKLGRSALMFAAIAGGPRAGEMNMAQLTALRFAADVIPWAMNGGVMRQVEMAVQP